MAKKEIRTMEVFVYPNSEKEPEDKTTYNCSICHRRFPEKAHLRYHLREHRTKPTKCLQCKRICRFLAPTQGFDVSTPKESPRYVCRFCNGSYGEITYLDFEITDEKNVKCLICSDKFINMKSFSEHYVDTHHKLSTPEKIVYQMMETMGKIFRTKKVYKDEDIIVFSSQSLILAHSR